MNIIRLLFSFFFLFLYESIVCQDLGELNIIAQQGHANKITTFTVDRNYKYLVSGDIRGVIKIWDYKTGSLIKTLNSVGCVQDIEIDSDKMIMITSHGDAHVVCYWSLDDFIPYTIQGLEFVQDFEVIPNSNILTYCKKNEIHFLDITTLKIVNTIKSPREELSIDDGGVEFTVDGKKVAVNGTFEDRSNGKFNLEPVILIFDTQSGSLLNILHDATYHSMSLSFNATGEYMASIDRDFDINIWDLKSNKIIHTKSERNGKYTHVSFINSNNLLLYGQRVPEKNEDQEIESPFLEVWDFTLQNRLRYESNIDEDQFNIFGPAIHLANDSIVIYPSWYNSINVYDLVRYKYVLQTGKPFDPITDVKFNEKKNTFLIAMKNELHYWNIENLTYDTELRYDDVSDISYDSYYTSALTKNIKGEVMLWDLAERDSNTTFSTSMGKNISPKDVSLASSYLSPSGKMAVYGNHDGQILVSKYPFSKTDTIIGEWDHESTGQNLNLTNPMDQVAFSSDDRFIAFTGVFSHKIKVYDQLQKKLYNIDTDYTATNLTISNDNQLAFVNSMGKASLYSLRENGPIEIKDFDFNDRHLFESKLRFSNNSNILAYGSNNGFLFAWDLKSDKLINKWDIGNSINSIEFNESDNLLIVSSENGSFKLFNLNDEKELLTISFMNSMSWLAFTPEGFFDGSGSAWNLAPMSFSSNPFALFQPEQFFNIFYQPDIIHDILKEEKNIAKILADRKDKRYNADISQYANSKLPIVEIVEGELDTSKRVQMFKFIVKDEGSGIRDLKIFHNGILVNHIAGELKINSRDNRYEINLPIKQVYDRNSISAYVFNDNNIKSKTVSVEISGSYGFRRKGNIYILSIGINQYEDTLLNLKYAEADASIFSQELEKSLSELTVGLKHPTKVYEKSYQYNLYGSDATRNNICDVIKALNGESNSIGKKLNIQAIFPEDILILYYSGHGYATKNKFYLIPHNAKTINDSLVNGISDYDLAELLKTIHCKELVFVIDACQSGQAITKDDIRNGPFNSTGLAQLAYEKGMYIIAASQSLQSALEVESLGHGLLTYTMINKGLLSLEADCAPKDKQINIVEWLNYSASNVPIEYKKAAEKKIKTKQGIPVSSDIHIQTPKVYFNRGSYNSSLSIKEWNSD
ncbi:MAG: hypothetical protein POELPBGB_01349 [Bacteroidia bacterium]|nr:hypothetical protein [Bacteroidia bacterium]